MTRCITTSSNTAILGILSMLAILILMPASGHAGDLPQMDGKLWKEQPKIVKQAYLVGINNLLDAEYAYQTKVAKSKPRSNQTLIQRMYESGDGETIDSVIKAVDAYYKANPKKLDKAVLDVLWISYVEKKKN